jgi:hypothetical protein
MSDKFISVAFAWKFVQTLRIEFDKKNSVEREIDRIDTCSFKAAFSFANLTAYALCISSSLTGPAWVQFMTVNIII